MFFGFKTQVEEHQFLVKRGGGLQQNVFLKYEPVY